MGLESSAGRVRLPAFADRLWLSARGATVLIVFALGLHIVNVQAMQSSAARETGDDAAGAVTLNDARRFFYNGDYDKAAAVASGLCAERPDDFDACELRTASLHFQIRKALSETGQRNDKTAAWEACAACPALMSAFMADTARGQAFARERLKLRAHDEETLFFLGKIDLNYVWLQLGTLGRKTGWDEYWEARRSLDQVLRMNPAHVRGRVARAWIDYIVGSSVPRGVRWLLGGGNKKRGLVAVREVVGSGGEFFDQVEARFALWDMQVREREIPGAIATARVLARDFPENRELRKFLTTYDSTSRATDPVDRAP